VRTATDSFGERSPVHLFTNKQSASVLISLEL